MFIGRRLDGTIYGAWTVRQSDDADHPRQEEIADNHPDVIAFLAPKPAVTSAAKLTAQTTLAAVQADVSVPASVKAALASIVSGLP